MERKFEFSVDEYYHIYNRGVDKREIFLTDKDRERFVLLLYICNNTRPVVTKSVQGESLENIDREDTLVDIGAYCLMPNHFHLLIREKEENGISVFMSKLTTAYAMYFNKKNERSGSLFQGAFKAKHVDDDNYLEYLYAYIHLNPIKLLQPDWKEKGITNHNQAEGFLGSYEFSSYNDYLGRSRDEGLILNCSVFPDYFSVAADFQRFTKYYLEQKELID